jgi:hypothetical protein
MMAVANGPSARAATPMQPKAAHLPEHLAAQVATNLGLRPQTNFFTLSIPQNIMRSR